MKFWLITNTMGVVVETSQYALGRPPAMGNGDSLPSGFTAHLLDSEKSLRQTNAVVEITG